MSPKPFKGGASSHADKFNGDLSRFCSGEIPQFEASGIQERNAANPASSRRLQNNENEQARQPEQNIPDWRDFPSQSPVCYGNDGFSTELLRLRIREDSLGLLSEKEIDTIISKAASKVRKESIKTGGNAVVTALVYQIFKAIEKYKKL
jgi:DNA (cytosine-5)-methyltransferase 1